MWGVLPTGAWWRQRTRGTCSVQTPFHNLLHSFQPCQPRCERWAMNPRADIDLYYQYPPAEKQRGKEGQPLLSAVACVCDAKKAVRCTEHGYCIALVGPATFPLGLPGSVVLFRVNFCLFSIVYLILHAINSSVHCLSLGFCTGPKTTSPDYPPVPSQPPPPWSAGTSRTGQPLHSSAAFISSPVTPQRLYICDLLRQQRIHIWKKFNR